ncbi:MAG: DNA double-strand break repair nuclease NurA [Anaerolineae bacterium]|nr:DNA double-strand break repair nuclease NurA [Anaerolineae bacterium]
MPVDFITIKDQIKKISAHAPEEAERLQGLHKQARELLAAHASEISALREKVNTAASQDAFLRCALPVKEELDAAFSVPRLPESATVLAADGSQINPDRHAALNFYLINVGALSMELGSIKAPETRVQSSLHFGEYTSAGTISESMVALQRDTRERAFLVELAQDAGQPLFTLTDGPLELWGGKGGSSEESESFTKNLAEYKQALTTLAGIGAATAGYVDKPRADLVVQLLEVAAAHREELGELRNKRPLRGATDANLFKEILEPGQRSAVYAIQSKSAREYAGPLGLHFFYLNVGRPGKPWLARVEVPSWVVENSEMLGNLHAILVDQCRMLGSRPYPYLLHRAHEEAVVTRLEKQQISDMLQRELQAQNLETGEESQKQSVKNLPGRRRFTLGQKRN